ncbi:MAG: type II toxin-antitoxin system YafQ family toxin [Rhodospirillales bacterium]
MEFKTTNRFDRDLRRMIKRGKNAAKIWRIVEILSTGGTLAPKHRPHILSGSMNGDRECHIEPDWLLIWRPTDAALILVRTGTHSDLFR